MFLCKTLNKEKNQQTCGVTCRLRNDFKDPFKRSNNDKSVGAFN